MWVITESFVFSLLVVTDSLAVSGIAAHVQDDEIGQAEIFQIRVPRNVPPLY